MRVPHQYWCFAGHHSQFGGRVWKLPVMPPAARTMCSSCGLCMALADGGLDGPDLGWRKHAGKGRVLPEPAAFLGVRFEDFADVGERSVENGLPFAVAADQGRRVRVLAHPATEI